MTALEKQFFDAFGIGFDGLLPRGTTKIPNYPPYNIIKTSEFTYLIEMAVAGFTEGDIEVTLEGNTLTITGSVSGVDEDAEYLHKGIATRPFTNTFTLADHVEVVDATIDNGMLMVKLKRVLPESDKPKTIPINRGGKEFLQD
jgi:molecular chaperone IbpA